MEAVNLKEQCDQVLSRYANVTISAHVEEELQNVIKEIRARVVRAIDAEVQVILSETVKQAIAANQMASVALTRINNHILEHEGYLL